MMSRPNLSNSIQIIAAIAFVVLISSCRKDEVSPSNSLPTNVSDDDYRWTWVGDWEFYQYTFVNDYMWVPDSTGGSWVDNSYTYNNWLDTGSVSFGYQPNTILIQYGPDQPSFQAFIDDWGNVTVETDPPGVAFNPECAASFSETHFTHCLDPYAQFYSGSYYTISEVKGTKL